MRSDLEPFFGTGGASSSTSERASRDFELEICQQKHNSGVEFYCSNNYANQFNLWEQQNKTAQVIFLEDPR